MPIVAKVSHADSPPIALSLSALTRAIRRQTVTVRARILSIADDARWLTNALSESASCATLPIFTNTRAGDWYVPTERVSGLCCFKSHDGHRSTIGFSATRLNLALGAAAAHAGGAVVVDATSSGSKRFPDSCVTIAVWAAVINAVRGLKVDDIEGAALSDFFPNWLPRGTLDEAIGVVSRTVEAMPAPLAAVIRSELSALGTRALVPLYVCQPSSSVTGNGGEWDETVWPLLDSDDGTVPIVFVSASRLVDEGGDVASAHAGWYYVSGAGDDHENWAGVFGLTASLFWAHRELLTTGFDDEALVQVVQGIGKAALAATLTAATIPFRSLQLHDARRLLGAAISVGDSSIVRVARPSAWISNDTVTEESPLPGTIFVVTVMIKGGSSSSSSSSSIEEGGEKRNGSNTDDDAPCVRRLCVPGEYKSARSRVIWNTQIFPVINESILKGGLILVAFQDTESAASASAITAAILLAARNSELLTKIDVRVSLALACTACVSPCVDKAIVKNLTRVYVPP